MDLERRPIDDRVYKRGEVWLSTGAEPGFLRVLRQDFDHADCCKKRSLLSHMGTTVPLRLCAAPVPC